MTTRWRHEGLGRHLESTVLFRDGWLVWLRGVLRQEQHADAVLAGSGQFDPGFLGGQFKKTVRRLDENARAIAGIGFAAASAAMIEIQEHFQGLLNDRMRFPALDIDNEPDSARFVLKLRIVQALFGGQPRPPCLFTPGSAL